MTTLHGASSARWAAGALAWAALAAAIWFTGDALVIGGRHPLDGPATRLMLIAAIAAVWLGWELWRARRSLRDNQRLLDGLLDGAANADSAERAAHELSLLRKRFEDALTTLRGARFRSPNSGRCTVAELPWYIFIGAPGSGKTTALVNAGLRFPLGDPRAGDALQGIGGTRNCDWWFTEEAVLLDTAGRYTTQQSDPEADAAAWRGFLDLLKKHRPRQPLNGALVTLSLSDLVHWDDEELARYAGHVRERLAELHSRLGVRLPVYLLVTKADLLAGFNEFFSDFDAERRAQVWGATFDTTELARQRSVAARFEPEFALLERRLYALLPDRLQEERDLQRRAAIYRFPQQFRVAGPLVSRFLEAAFDHPSAEGAPFVRGVYFTSGTQEGSPIDRVLGTLARSFNLERKVQPPAAGTGKSFFLRRLLRDVVFAEAGLAGVDARQERRRRNVLAAGFAGIFGLALALAGLWTASYVKNRQLVAAAHAETTAAKSELAHALTPRDEQQLIFLLDSLRDLQARVQPVGLHVDAGLGQGAKLGVQARRAYRNALEQVLLPHLVSTLEEDLRRAPSRDALAAYLSLYDSKGPDATAIQAALARSWNLPHSSRSHLAVHLHAALEDRPFVLPHRRDDALVAAVRRKLGPAAGL